MKCINPDCKDGKVPIPDGSYGGMTIKNCTITCLDCHGTGKKGEQMKICKWTNVEPDDGSFWESPCGVAFTFTDGGPWHNGMRFCFKCGKPMFKGVAKKLEMEGK